MIPLHKYQREAIDYGTDNNLFITDNAGMGKTRQACGIINGVFNKHIHTLTRPVLIITRKKIFDKWLEELDKWLVDYNCIVLDEVDKVKKFALASKKIYPMSGWPEKTIVLVYHEAVRHLNNGLKTWGMIILDEAHRIKNPSAKITKEFVKFKAYRLVAMTATKMDKSPLDMYVVLKWLYPHLIGTRRQFRDEYVDIIFDFRGFPKIIGGKNLDKLAKLIGPFTFDRIKEEELPDFPTLKFTKVNIDITGQQLEAYNKLHKSTELTVEIENENIYIPNVLAQMVREQQLLTDPTLLNLNIESAKLNWLYNWIEENNDKSFIIFSMFRDTVLKISNKFNIPAIIGGKTIDLSTNPKQLVSTIAAGNDALDLYWIDYGIFIDETWNSVHMRQGYDRIHRISNYAQKEVIILQSSAQYKNKKVVTVDSVVRTTLEKKYDVDAMVKMYLKNMQLYS